MSKSSQLFAVTKFEFIRQVKKPSFWISILLIPLLIGGMFLVSFVVSGNKPSDAKLNEDTKVAVTDEAGILPSNNPYVIKENREKGVEMVKNKDVKFYFYIPADFENTKKVDFYHISEGLDLFNNDSAIIKSILKQAVASNLDQLEVIALTSDFEVTDNKLTSTGETSNALGKAIIPLSFLIIFFLFVCLFGNRLLMTVVEEKENRISEMILTTVNAKHMIIGKIIAMMLLGIIQILAFVIPAIVIVFINRDNPVVSSILSSIEINPLNIIVSLLLFLFSTFLVIGVCTYIGTITPTAKDASQFIGPVIIAIMLPLYFVQAFFATDPSTMVQILTYFPLSAPIALMLRTAVGTLSTPELIIGITELVIVSIFVIRLTIHTFQKNAINFELVKPKFSIKKR